MLCNTSQGQPLHARVVTEVNIKTHENGIVFHSWVMVPQLLFLYEVAPLQHQDIQLGAAGMAEEPVDQVIEQFHVHRECLSPSNLARHISNNLAELNSHKSNLRIKYDGRLT